MYIYWYWWAFLIDRENCVCIWHPEMLNEYIWMTHIDMYIKCNKRKHKHKYPILRMVMLWFRLILGMFFKCFCGMRPNIYVVADSNITFYKLYFQLWNEQEKLIFINIFFICYIVSQWNMYSIHPQTCLAELESKFICLLATCHAGCITLTGVRQLSRHFP